MNPLSIRSLFHSVATLINLPRLHGLKIIHELQKEPNYLLKNPFSKSSNYSGIRAQNCQKKMRKNNFQSSLPEVFLKNTALDSLLNQPAAGNSDIKGLRHSCFRINFANSPDDCF